MLSSFLIAHSFGRRMLYPGSVGLLQKAMRATLQQGQARLIEEVRMQRALFVPHNSAASRGENKTKLIFVGLQFDGQRNKLVACDGNEIDTMFVDRRRDGGENGQTLVKLSTGSFH